MSGKCEDQNVLGRKLLPGPRCRPAFGCHCLAFPPFSGTSSCTGSPSEYCPWHHPGLKDLPSAVPAAANTQVLTITPHTQDFPLTTAKDTMGHPAIAGSNLLAL